MANCTFEKVYSNQGVIKRVDDGVILVNNAIAEVRSNCSDNNQTLNGSYLINFERCTLQINGQLYVNDETTIKKHSYLPTTGILVKEVDLIDTLPLEYLQNITLDQRERLQTVNLTSRSWMTGIIGSISISTVILLSLLGKFALYLYRKRKTRVNVEISRNALLLNDQHGELRGRSNLRMEELPSTETNLTGRQS